MRGGKGGRAITHRISAVRCVEIIEQKRKTLRQTKHNTTQKNSWSAFDQSRESTKKSNQLDC